MSGKIIFATVLGLAAIGAALGASALRAYGEENHPGPSFEVIRSLGEDMELRHYKPRIVAELELDDGEDAMNRSFRILAAYIFGKNTRKQEIEMTSPVLTQAEKLPMTSPVTTSTRNNKMTMRFFMPAGYTLESLPEPIDKRIRFQELPAETFAVIRFSGSWMRANFNKNAEQLLERLKMENVIVAGQLLFAYYNPPFVPSFFRHNEVLVPVKEF